MKLKAYRGQQGRNEQEPKLWLAVLAAAVALVTAFFLWASWKSEQIIAELKSIAERLQAEPGRENLDTQSPVVAALCIPLDRPCSQYAYRWDAHRTGMRRLPTS